MFCPLGLMTLPQAKNKRHLTDLNPQEKNRRK
jgi:hypothetical protein